ncbi:hypothetical protein [Philodulcilactobacillus myokoensis]|nr:hypothetical protein [Philodulcilactobacillus myokoensis]
MLIKGIKQEYQERIFKHDCVNIANIKLRHLEHRTITSDINWNNVLMLINIKHHHHQYATLILEKYYGFYLVKQTVNQLMSCLWNSHEFFDPFTVKTIGKFMDVKSRIPLVIDNFVMIPMTPESKDDQNRTWICSHHLNGNYSTENDQCDLIFKDYEHTIRFNEQSEYVKRRIEEAGRIQAFIKIILNSPQRNIQEVLNPLNHSYLGGKTYQQFENFRDKEMVKKVLKYLEYDKMSKERLDEMMKTIKQNKI